MKKILIVLGVVIAVIVAVVGYAVFNLSSLISANRDYALARASDALGRPIETGDIQTSLGWGVKIVVNDVRVADDPAFAKEPFLEAKQVFLNVELLPLLTRSLVVTSLNITQPSVRIVRDRDGALNVSTLSKQSPKTEPSSSNPSKGVTPQRELNAPLQSQSSQTGGKKISSVSNLSVGKFVIDDGTVDYLDLQAGGKPVRLQHVDLAVEQFTFDSSFPIELTIAALGSKRDIEVSGQVGPLMHEGSVTPTLIPLNLKAQVGPVALNELRSLPQIGKALPPDLSIADPVTLDAQVSGTVGSIRLASSGELGANHIAYGKLFDKPAGTPLTYKVEGSSTQNKITLTRADVQLADLTLKASDIALNDGDLSAHLDTNSFDLAGVAKILTMAQQYNPRGSAEIHAKVSYAQHKPTIDGTVALTKVNMSLPDRPTPPVSDLSGTIKIAGESVHAAPLTFNLGSGHATLNADAQSINPIRASYQLNVDTLKVGEIVASRQNLGEQLTALVANGTLTRDSTGNITAGANVTSSSGMVSNVAYQDFALAANYAADLLTINSLKLGAFDGMVGASGRATLGKAPTFDLNLDATKVDLQKALQSQKAKAAETVRGILTGNLKISGSGANFDAIRPTLRGTGAANVDNAKLVGVNVAAQALKKVDNLPQIGALVPPSVVARHPALFNSPDTVIDQASLTFTVTGPRLTSHDITARTTDYTIFGDGWFDMDKNVDIAARILLSKAFSSELADARKNVTYLENKDSQVVIPLVIKGQLPKPSVLPDVTALTQRAAGNALTNKLENLLGGKKSGGGKSGSGKSSNPLDQLKGLFR